MNDIVNIKIFEDKELVKSLDVRLPVILGRQDSVEAGLYTLQGNQVPPKITIANLSETTVGRSHLLLEPLLNGLVAITNVNPNRAVQILDKANLAPKATFHSELPTSITFETHHSQCLRQRVDEHQIQNDSTAEQSDPTFVV